MDHKSWLWKRRSAEKTLPADKTNSSSRGNGDEEKEANEVRELITEKAELERDLRILHDEHSFGVSKCNDKDDDIVRKQIEITHEAVEGWENARKEALSLKKDLEKALQQKTISEERSSQLDAALKECTRQLRFVREDQEKRIHDAVIKTSEDYGRRVHMLENENAHIKDSMLEKDKLIEELNRQKTIKEGDFNALASRAHSYEKENASLRYEVCVLEKEREIRNEEREFNRRTAAAAVKKQQESDRKIAELEQECKKLRVLVKKRLPGAADLAKMKKEVENLGKNQGDNRRRRLNLYDDTPSSKIEFLMERLHMVEEENRSLKHELQKKPYETQSLYLDISSKVKKSVKGHMNREKSTYPIGFRDDDEVSCAESWASALLSELDLCRNVRELRTPSHRTIISTPEINLLDDFTEMEKLAVVSVAESSHHSSDEGHDSSASNRKKKATEQINVSEPINKILELLGGINIASEENDSLGIKNDSGSSMGYLVRVFQWKAAEVSNVLKLLVQSCNDLLKGTGDLENFALVVASSLEWIVNHCFSIQDVPTMKYGIRNHFDWDETISENEIDTCLENHISVPNVSLVSPLGGHRSNESDEKDKQDHNGALIVNSGDRNESKIENLRSRMRSMRIQTEDISYLEDEEINRSSSRKILEETNIRMTTEDAVDGNNKVTEHQKQDSEITAASEKLAECQETLRNLGIQLKALASPEEAAALLNEVIPTPADPVIKSTTIPKESISERFSLLDKMAEEEDDKAGAHSIIRDDMKSGIKDSTVNSNTAMDSSDEMDGDAEKVAGSSLAVVPLRKKNGTVSFFKKLFRRKKRSTAAAGKHSSLKLQAKAAAPK